MSCIRCDSEEAGGAAVFDFHVIVCFPCLNDFEEFSREHPNFKALRDAKSRQHALAISAYAGDGSSRSFWERALEIEQEIDEVEHSLYFTVKAWFEQKVKRD